MRILFPGLSVWTLVSVCSCPVLAQGTLFVDVDMAPGGDGLSWVSAFPDVQEAIDVAEQPGSTVTEIWVAEGIYLPDERRVVGDPRSATYLIPDGVVIYGGFEGSESTIEEREIELHPTVFVGDVQGNDGNDFLNYDDNLYHVVTATEISNAGLDGVVIERGNAVSSFSTFLDEFRGGGLYVSGAEVVVRNCRFRINSASCRGGALFGDTGTVASSVTLENTDFIDNRVVAPDGFACDGEGGGVHFRFGTLSLSDCTFTANTSSEEAGAVYAHQAEASFQDCEFDQNTAEREAGAVLSIQGQATWRDCSFTDNSATVSGAGAVRYLGTDTTVVDCLFQGNSGPDAGAVIGSGSGAVWNSVFAFNVSQAGAGALVESGDDRLYVNCLFRDNFTESGAGALASDAITLQLVHITVINNTSQFTTGGLTVSGFVTLRNSIIWGNVGTHPSTELNQIQRVGTAEVDGGFSCVQGWTGLLGGVGILDEHPVYSDVSGRLGFESPCLETGEVRSLISDLADLDGDGDVDEPVPVDLDGNRRIVGRGVDMGAFEGAVPCAFPLGFDCNGNGVPDGCEADCNGNGASDDCDITTGVSTDCNANGIPDECEVDCNGNGIPDPCDIAQGDSSDCNRDGVPDECAAAISQEITVLGSDAPDPDDEFGEYVAVTPQYVLVGALGDDDQASAAGAVYVFKQEGISWILDDKLFASDAEFADRFGIVAANSDRLVVGAASSDDFGSSSGSAYIFRDDGGIWSEEAKLLPDDGQAGDRFGAAVAIDGLLAAVGAPSAQDSTGAVYIYERQGTDWFFQQKLVASNGVPDDFFGESVSLSGSRLLVGASQHEDAAGAAYFFELQGATWVETDFVVASDADEHWGFGRSVTLDGDTAVIGAPLADDTFTNAGLLYVFERETGSWSEIARLSASKPGSFNTLGSAVSLQDGVLIAGARESDVLGDDSGAAYVYRRIHSQWIETHRLLSSDGAPGDRFGVSVALQGDHAVVGADNKNGFTGSAYSFYGVRLGDCNDNGVLDSCDITSGGSEDCNRNGLPDECELASLLVPDENENGVPDSCELNFIRGDADGDGLFNAVVDGIFLLTYAFIPGSPVPPCLESVEADGDAIFNGAVDGIFLLSCAFIPGSPCMGRPFPDCDLDPDLESTLGCDGSGCP